MTCWNHHADLFGAIEMWERQSDLVVIPDETGRGPLWAFGIRE